MYLQAHNFNAGPLDRAPFPCSRRPGVSPPVSGLGGLGYGDLRRAALRSRGFGAVGPTIGTNPALLSPSNPCFDSSWWGSIVHSWGGSTQKELDCLNAQIPASAPVYTGSDAGGPYADQGILSETIDYWANQGQFNTGAPANPDACQSALGVSCWLVVGGAAALGLILYAMKGRRR